jgi:3-hydroxypropanoate dehydrogenase
LDETPLSVHIALPISGAEEVPMPQARTEELALIFREARTHSVWLDRPVEDGLLEQLYALTRMGPTSANTHPLRIAFVRSAEAKEKLLPAILPLNTEKTRTAPVTAILAYDSAFYENMPRLVPARPDLRERFAGLPVDVRDKMAEQSALIAVGYFVLAARAVGLDAGPMAGFDANAVNAAFFPDGTWRTLLLVNLGYGDASQLAPRNPRLSFDEACRIV